MATKKPSPLAESLLAIALLAGTAFLAPAVAAGPDPVGEIVDPVLEEIDAQRRCPDTLRFGGYVVLTVTGNAWWHSDIGKCVFHGDVNADLDPSGADCCGYSFQWSVIQQGVGNEGASYQRTVNTNSHDAWRIHVDSHDIYDISFSPPNKYAPTGYWHQTDACPPWQVCYVNAPPSDLSVHAQPANDTYGDVYDTAYALLP